MSLEVIKYENVSEWPIAEDNVLGEKLELMEGEQNRCLFIIFRANRNMSRLLDHFLTTSRNIGILEFFFSPDLLLNIFLSILKPE